MYLLIIIFFKSEFMAAQRARPILLNERFLVICAPLIICYGRRYLERTCVECGNGGRLEGTMQQMRRAVIKKVLSIVRKLKEDSESTR